MSVQRWIRQFARRPGDTEAEASSKALILVIALSCSACGLIWGAVYAAVLGLGPTAALPFAFTVIVGGTAIVSARLSDHRPLIYAQIGCITWIPALIEWTFGSMSGSGLVIAWSFMGPIGALMFLSLRQALVWMGVFLGIVVVSAVFQPALLGAPIAVPAAVQSVFFAMNVGMASVVVFAAAAWFVRTIQRELALRLEANAALAESHRKLAASQQVIIQSEKMAALGRLSAGMAHELNNPAAATLRGSGQLREAVDGLWRASIALVRARLESWQFDRLTQLMVIAEKRAREPLEHSAADRIEREAEVEAALDGRGLTALERYAPELVDLGIDDAALEELHDAFGDAALVSALECAMHWCVVVSLIAEIQGGSGRITAIVGALKSYTFLDRGEVQTVDLNGGLNDTLVMMKSALGDGIAVRLDLDPTLPVITAQGGNLNQVWTHLIANAAEAMNGEGELSVRSRREDDEAVIQIIDTGPGIPPEIADCLFDPFVTTKPVGTSPGLGLYVSRNTIVQQHGGTLEVDSRPGRTCFEVRLPLLPTDTESVEAPTRVGVSAGPFTASH